MSQLYLYEANELISNKAKELIFSLSEGSEQKFLLMGLKRFTKYFEYPKPIELKSLIPNDIFLSSLSIESITASTSSPTLTKSWAD